MVEFVLLVLLTQQDANNKNNPKYLTQTYSNTK
jgi:hypothetical protein